jgi:hypothetical protein
MEVVLRMLEAQAASQLQKSETIASLFLQAELRQHGRHPQEFLAFDIWSLVVALVVTAVIVVFIGVAVVVEAEFSIQP